MGAYTRCAISSEDSDGGRCRYPGAHVQSALRMGHESWHQPSQSPHLQLLAHRTAACRGLQSGCSPRRMGPPLLTVDTARHATSCDCFCLLVQFTLYTRPDVQHSLNAQLGCFLHRAMGRATCSCRALAPYAWDAQNSRQQKGSEKQSVELANMAFCACQRPHLQAPSGMPSSTY